MAKTPAQRAAKHGNSAVQPQSIQTPEEATFIRVQERKEGNPALILIAAAVASLFLFWYLHILVLNQMKDIAGGLTMPDNMFFGFTFDQVEALRSAMNSDANGQLQFVHKTAGTLFPLVTALTVVLIIGLKVLEKRVSRLLWIVPIAFAICHIAANICIDNMLDAKTLDAGLVTAASWLVTASWLLLVASAAIAVGALLFGRKSLKAQPAAA